MLSVSPLTHAHSDTAFNTVSGCIVGLLNGTVTGGTNQILVGLDGQVEAKGLIYGFVDGTNRSFVISETSYGSSADALIGIVDVSANPRDALDTIQQILDFKDAENFPFALVSALAFIMKVIHL